MIAKFLACLMTLFCPRLKKFKAAKSGGFSIKNGYFNNGDTMTLQNFDDALRAAGYEPLKPVHIAEGAPWPRLRYDGEKRPSGRYRLAQDPQGRLMGHFGSDKDPKGWHKWRSYDSKTFTGEERKAIREWEEQQRKAHEAALHEAQSRLADKLTGIYKRMPRPDKRHKYIKDKRIEPFSAKLRAKTGVLVVPIMQLDGRVWSFEFIAPSGTKWRQRGGAVKGGFCPITKEGDTFDIIFITEGYSTGVTVRIATDKPVFVAFNAGNLKPVAQALREKYPDAEIIIAGDNDDMPPKDWKGKNWTNAGVKYGTEAAGLVRGRLLFPEFDDENKGTDWNDFYCAYGIDAVKKELEVVFKQPTAQQASSVPALDSPAAHIQISPQDEIWFEERQKCRYKDGSRTMYDERYSLHNAMIFLAHNPSWAGTFCYDEFSHKHQIVKPLPWDDAKNFKWREISDNDLTQMRAMIYSNHNMKFTSNKEMHDCLSVVCTKNPRHPVREYFDTLAEHWDGDARLDYLAERYFNAKGGNTDYLRRVSPCILIAAIHRVYNPGAFFKHMVVLEGEQNVGKSTAIRLLGTHEGVNYCNDRLSFRDLENPYLAAHTAGYIFLEFAELKGMARQDQNIVKGWISQTHDAMRPIQKMKITNYPRQFIPWSTTNEAYWARDTTGNVRFWPIDCGKIDLEAIERDNKQLWAEAMHRYKKGEIYYIPDTDPVYEFMKIEQNNRVASSMWDEYIADYVEAKSQVAIRDVMKDALFLPIERQNDPKHLEAVQAALRKLGYKSKTAYCPIERRTSRHLYVKAGYDNT